jgi:hypothetical protein
VLLLRFRESFIEDSDGRRLDLAEERGFVFGPSEPELDPADPGEKADDLQWIGGIRAIERRRVEALGADEA